MNFSKWSANKLKITYRQIYNSIFLMDCYGTKDLVLMHLITTELNRRGIEIVGTVEFKNK